MFCNPHIQRRDTRTYMHVNALFETLLYIGAYSNVASDHLSRL